MSTRTDLSFMRRRPPVAAASVASSAAAPALPMTAPPAPDSLVRPAAATLTTPDLLVPPPAAPDLLVAPLVTPTPMASTHAPGAPALTLAPPAGAASAAASRRAPLPKLLRGMPMLHADHVGALDASTPAVMLGRVPSATGTLTVSAVTAPPAQPVVAYEARGTQGVLTGGNGCGPDAAYPRVSLTGGKASVDLGHINEIRRFLVLVDSATADGTVLIATDSGIRLSIALEPDPRPGHLAALSGYVTRGALVLRTERRHVPGTLRDAITAFDYRSVNWASPNIPLPPQA